MKRICVYCGSNPGNDPVYLKAATMLGEAMARRGLGLVYGGASIGLMGRIADTMIAHGGEVIGVIPRSLFKNEVAHTGLSELITVDSMHLRKEKMASLADGFVALPGGFGTLEEVFEAITWTQIRVHVKPVGLLNVSGYYELLSGFIDHAVSQGFIKRKHQLLYTMASDPDMLIAQMDNMVAKM